MIALPFIEAIKESRNQYRRDSPLRGLFDHEDELREFYSQPFDIGMLVNPIEKPKMLSSKTGKLINPSIKLMKKADEWQEAEDRGLFKGNYLKQVKDHVDDKEKETEWTLNEFLVVCTLANKNNTADALPNERVTLHWKQQIVDKYFNH